MQINIVQGDAFAYSADVLALKYAQDLYGLDYDVVTHLNDHGIDLYDALPEIDHYSLRPTQACMGADSVLMIGVPELEQFGYEEVRSFGRNTLYSLAQTAPTTRQLMLTIHGPDVGLELCTAFRAQLDGLLDAIQAGQFPPWLDKIIIIENDPERANHLQYALDEALLEGILILHPAHGVISVTQ